jgi:hypothetical protein
MHSLPLNPYLKKQRAAGRQAPARIAIVAGARLLHTPSLLLRQLCPTLSFFPPQLPLLAAATARAYIMKTIIAPANTQVFSFRHSTFNQREKMTTNDEWPKFKRLSEFEYVDREPVPQVVAQRRLPQVFVVARARVRQDGDRQDGDQ